MKRMLAILAIISCFILGVNSQIHQYQVYISPFWPLTKCEASDSQLILESHKPITLQQMKVISGYEVSLVLQNIKNMKNDKYYTIQLNCVDARNFNSILASQQSTTDITVIGIGAQKITQDILNQNLIPSMPIYQAALKAINQKVQSKSYWTLFKPISIEVGIGYLALGLVVSLIVWFMEERAWKQPKIQHFHNILEIAYDVFSSLFFTNLIHLQKVSSRIVLWFFWFTTFVCIVIYQANLTLKISESYTSTQIQSFKQGLESGHKFGIFDTYQKNLLLLYPEYASSFVIYPTIDSSDSIAKLFLELDSKQLDGIVLETPLADYFCSLYCQSETVDEIIFSFNYVSLFAKGTNPTIIQDYNKSLSKSKQTYPLNTIKSEIFDVTGLSTCQAPEVQITTSELAGVWIILSVTFGVTLLIWGVQRCFKIKQRSSTNYYYQFQNQKNQQFEDRLKMQIQNEVQEILHNYKDNFIKQIEIFERNLMLQDIDEKGQHNSESNSTPLKESALHNNNNNNNNQDSHNEVHKRQIKKQSE